MHHIELSYLYSRTKKTNSISIFCHLYCDGAAEVTGPGQKPRHPSLQLLQGVLRPERIHTIPPTSFRSALGLFPVGHALTTSKWGVLIRWLNQFIERSQLTWVQITELITLGWARPPCSFQLLVSGTIFPSWSKQFYRRWELECGQTSKSRALSCNSTLPSPPVTEATPS